MSLAENVMCLCGRAEEKQRKRPLLNLRGTLQPMNNFFFFLPDVPGRDIHCCDDLQLVESNHHFISVYLWVNDTKSVNLEGNGCQCWATAMYCWVRWDYRQESNEGACFVLASKRKCVFSFLPPFPILSERWILIAKNPGCQVGPTERSGSITFLVPHCMDVGYSYRF